MSSREDKMGCMWELIRKAAGWVWSRIRKRPTAVASRGAVAAGESVHIRGALVNAHEAEVTQIRTERRVYIHNAQQVVIAASRDSPEDELNRLLNDATEKRKAGRSGEAIELYWSTISACRDRKDVVTVLGNLGLAYLGSEPDVGDDGTDVAVAYFLAASRAAKHEGMELHQAAGYEFAGVACGAAGRLGEAGKYYRASAEIYEAAGELVKAADLFAQASNALYLNGTDSEGIHLGTRAAKLYESVGNHTAQARALIVVGKAQANDDRADFEAIQHDGGDRPSRNFGPAKASISIALALATSAKNPELEAEAAEAYAYVCLIESINEAFTSGDVERPVAEGLHHLERARQLYSLSDNQQGLASVLELERQLTRTSGQW